MACAGRCIAIRDQVPDPLDRGRETVVSVAPMKKPWGETWGPGVVHWRCDDCVRKKSKGVIEIDMTKPAPRPVQTRAPTPEERFEELKRWARRKGIY